MTCVYYCCTLSGTKKVQIKEKKRLTTRVISRVKSMCYTRGGHKL